MKKFLFCFCVILFFTSLSYSAELDPGYIKAFGQGAILVSGKGFPDVTKYNPEQFDYKDGKFYITASEEATINFRVILPKGKTIGNYVKQLKKERGTNLKYRTEDWICLQIFPSFDSSGENLVNEKKPWPKKLTDIPKWCSPIQAWWGNIDSSNENSTFFGLKWDGDLGRDLGSTLHRAEAGNKFYVMMTVCYEYKTPGGEIENKWDSILQKWIPVKSTGLLGYVHSDPILACTIEIKKGKIEGENKFKDNGDGTITDIQSGLTWIKSIPTEKMRFEDAQKYVESLNIGGYNDWRIPTVTELQSLNKGIPKKFEYEPVKFLTNSGFVNISDGNEFWSIDIALENEQCRNYVSFYSNNEWSSSYVWTNTELALYSILPVRSAK
ncbi:MAG: DUF1566 domain-containing protein [Desulfobacterales bacterium]|nr:DUF1566 domain-containing protein [Desulfobacterales bacterium]